MPPDSLRILKAHGYKITLPRKQVLNVLEEAQKPVSPYLIQDILRQQGKYLNHVTIYRILDLFCRLNLAHRMLLSGEFVKCGLGNIKGCHRFIVCRGCGAFQEFADEGLCHEETAFAENLGFHTEHHFSESSGLCASCHKKESGEQEDARRERA